MINLPNQAARQRERLLFEREIDAIARGARRQIRTEINRFSKDVGEIYKQGERVGILAEALPYHRQNIEAILKTLYRRSMDAGGQRMIRAAKSWRPYFETKNEETAIKLALDWWLGDILPLRVRQITVVSKRIAQDSIKQGVLASESPAEIARRLVKGGLSKVRATRIARTESLASASASQHKVAQDINPGFKKRWVATLDSRTRDTHDEADGQLKGMQLQFNVGGSKLLYPRDVGAPAKEVVNCRCVVIYED